MEDPVKLTPNSPLQPRKVAEEPTIEAVESHPKVPEKEVPDIRSQDIYPVKETVSRASLPEHSEESILKAVESEPKAHEDDDPQMKVTIDKPVTEMVEEVNQPAAESLDKRDEAPTDVIEEPLIAKRTESIAIADDHPIVAASDAPASLPTETLKDDAPVKADESVHQPIVTAEHANEEASKPAEQIATPSEPAAAESVQASTDIPKDTASAVAKRTHCLENSGGSSLDAYEDTVETMSAVASKPDQTAYVDK